ncbi:hypothetical protein RIF29_08239 [Crotalaria pallida]|uniref:F-box domain-containing protein n=1 Tax=Crotalaria pallida TaxID=3830 RepID=A0AAN9PBA7_CROPI
MARGDNNIYVLHGRGIKMMELNSKGAVIQNAEWKTDRNPNLKMENLPEELISEILSRSDVKSLLQLRSTCRSLRSLIDSPFFILYHLNNATHSHTIIFPRRSDLFQLPLPLPLHLHSHSHTHTHSIARHLSHPLISSSKFINLLGSFNGLFCISSDSEDIIFWNPSTRKHKLLPYLPEDENNHNNYFTIFAARVYGFGFDSVTDDYKLVRISYFVDPSTRHFNTDVKLYSLRNNAWKTLPNIMPYALCFARTMGVFVGGALHWVVTRRLQPDEPDLIVAFDLVQESFREVPLPETGNVNGIYGMEVVLLGGCLCMIETRGSESIDVWVMKEYGSRESWSKLLSLTDMKSVKPLGYSRDGGQVLLEKNRKKLCWYDLKTKQVTYVNVPGLPNSIAGMICMETLVPPTLLHESDSQQQNLEEETYAKRRYRFHYLYRSFLLFEWYPLIIPMYCVILFGSAFVFTLT